MVRESRRRHERLDGRKIGQQRRLAENHFAALLLQILIGGYGVLKIGGQPFVNLALHDGAENQETDDGPRNKEHQQRYEQGGSCTKPIHLPFLRVPFLRCA